MRINDHIRFVKDCLAAGFTPFAYEGRLFYIGPAVVSESLTDTTRLNTTVPISWDDMGKGFVVFPSKSTNETDPERLEAVLFLQKIREKSGLN